MRLHKTKENMLWNIFLGTGVYLLDSLRNRLSEGIIGDLGDRARDLGDRAREGYGEAYRRVSRASDVMRGEDHGLGTVAALFIGMGVGVGIGMLLAPASGEETRSTISNKVQEFGDRMRDKFSHEQQPHPSVSGTYGT